MSEVVLSHPDNEEPNVFTQAEVGWLPWLQPLVESELTDAHWEGLVERQRSKSEYFMLLARDPDILRARTKTDNDIFYNQQSGLPRAERELAAAATSRSNGCIFCASVHARFATRHSKRNDDVQSLLDEGVGVELDPRWNAIIRASVELTETPISFSTGTIEELMSVGLDAAGVVDLIYATAFFNWANRLMLSLGEPTPPSTAAR